MAYMYGVNEFGVCVLEGDVENLSGESRAIFSCKHPFRSCLKKTYMVASEPGKVYDFKLWLEEYDFEKAKDILREYFKGKLDAVEEDYKRDKAYYMEILDSIDGEMRNGDESDDGCGGI